MINQNRKKLGLISLLFFIFFNCKIDSSLSGLWKVKSIDIIISEDMEYLEELKPDFVRVRLKNRFPKSLKRNDVIDLNTKGKLIINKTDTLQYYSHDSTINVIKSDALFTLNYRADDEILIFKSYFERSKIQWIFEKFEDPN